MKALIGSTGFVGGVLLEQIKFNKLYNSRNISDIVNYSFDEVYCAAPSGNRLITAQNPAADYNNVVNLINILRTVNTKRFILIGTIDSVNCTNTAYGQNRKLIEDAVQDTFNDYTIVRLPSLIHPNIHKNILYDLKNGVYLEKVNLSQNNQWYPMHRLSKDIKNLDIDVANLVSVPISNQSIVDMVRPGIGLHLPANLYDLKFKDGYLLDKDEICAEILNYFK